MTSDVMVPVGRDGYGAVMTTAGALLREWRLRRNRSQLSLAVDAGVSTRHLSFVETGRSRPSPELLLTLADHLDVPLRERNALLLAAGYAPRYGESSLDDERMATVRASLQRLLDAHHPYPGVVVDRRWDVVAANDAALVLMAGLPEAVTARPNIYRLSLHPDGLAGATLNFTDWATYLVQQLRRSVRSTGDRRVAELLDEVLGYPDVARLQPLMDMADWSDPPLLVPFRLASAVGEVAMFTTLTSFGTPRDVTLDELVVELFYPADETSAERLERLTGGLRAGAG